MFKTLMTATALTGALTLSANALELGAGVDAGISFDDGVAVSAGVSASADADGSTDAKTKLKDDGYAVAADSNFIGDSVETADGVMIGSVTDVYGKADSDQRVRIELNEEANLEKPDAFWMSLTADADSDGKLILPWTLAEFQANMHSHVDG